MYQAPSSTGSHDTVLRYDWGPSRLQREPGHPPQQKIRKEVKNPLTVRFPHAIPHYCYYGAAPKPMRAKVENGVPVLF
jgi:hypothetical protein